MQRILPGLLLALSLSCPLASRSGEAVYDLQPGDIVFQSTGGRQCEVIRAATGSSHSHCGVIFSSRGKLYVFEATHPVASVPLEVFRKRSLPGTFHARRLKTAEETITVACLEKARNWSHQNLGKPYDGKFLWDDESLYCSELVWKVFKACGDVELCKPRQFKTLNTGPAMVQAMIVDRFGSLEHFPAESIVVTPEDLMTSPHLVEVPRLARKKK